MFVDLFVQKGHIVITLLKCWNSIHFMITKWMRRWQNSLNPNSCSSLAPKYENNYCLIQPLEQKGRSKKNCIAIYIGVFMNHFDQMIFDTEHLSILMYQKKYWYLCLSKSWEITFPQEFFHYQLSTPPAVQWNPYKATNELWSLKAGGFS